MVDDFEDDFDDDDLDEDTEDSLEEEEEEEEEEEINQDLNANASSDQAIHPPPICAQDIPVNLCIELARLKMSAKKLLDLRPGNLIETGILPANGLDLVVNGKRIAKAELVQVGEALAVRVMEIA